MRAHCICFNGFELSSTDTVNDCERKCGPKCGSRKVKESKTAEKKRECVLYNAIWLEWKIVCHAFIEHAYELMYEQAKERFCRTRVYLCMSKKKEKHTHTIYATI